MSEAAPGAIQVDNVSRRFRVYPQPVRTLKDFVTLAQQKPGTLMLNLSLPPDQVTANAGNGRALARSIEMTSDTEPYMPNSATEPARKRCAQSQQVQIKRGAG